MLHEEAWWYLPLWSFITFELSTFMAWSWIHGQLIARKPSFLLVARHFASIRINVTKSGSNRDTRTKLEPNKSTSKNQLKKTNTFSSLSLKIWLWSTSSHEPSTKESTGVKWLWRSLVWSLCWNAVSHFFISSICPVTPVTELTLDGTGGDGMSAQKEIEGKNRRNRTTHFF